MSKNTEAQAAVEYLSAEAIIAADDLAPIDVEVPEWGGIVRIQGFTKAQQQDVRRRATIGDKIDSDRLEVLTFMEGIVAPRFSEDQYEQLRNKAAGPVDRILTRLMEISGLTKDAVATAEKSVSG